MSDSRIQTPSSIYCLNTGARLRGLDSKDAGRPSTIVDPSFAEPSEWLQFLWEATDGSEKLQKFIQIALGYTMTGSMVEQRMFSLYGPPESGKHTFLSTIQIILGGLAARDINLKRASQCISETRCLVYSEDYFHNLNDNDRQMIRNELLSIIGCDIQSSCPLYKDPFYYEPKMKIWTSCTRIPEKREAGLPGRICYIPFSPEIKQNISKFIPEYPAILGWMMRGAHRWMNGDPLELAHA